MSRILNSGQASYVHFTTGHEDLVHDVAYDPYGKRMATVSSDQKLKIFDQNEDKEWVLSSSFRAHDASITRVLWGPPEHGQIIATCSHDRTVKIWEEQEMEPKSSPNRWKRQVTMNPENSAAIHGIAFSPTSLSSSSSSSSTGLKLAFISTDGVISIHECREPQDLTHWINGDVIHVLPAPPLREVEVSFCIAYCPSRPGGEQLVVGAMDTVRIYRQNATGKFRPAEELLGHRNLVRDVAWARSVGRSFHLIATACKDGHVRIFKLTHSSMNYVIKPKPRHMMVGHGGRNMGAGLSQGLGGTDNSIPEGDEGDDAEKWGVQMVADFDDHKCEVSKVAWNLTGTVLSSAGDDGKVRLWKAGLNGAYQLLSVANTPRSRGSREDKKVSEDD